MLMDAATTVKAYKSLSQVEEAFRRYKSIDLKVRPIYHYQGDRVKAHIFLCMLAYYVEWHLKQSLAPLSRYFRGRQRGRRGKGTTKKTTRRIASG